MKRHPFSSGLLFIALVFLTACEPKKIPLGDQPGAKLFHGMPLVNNGKTLPRDLFVKTVLNSRNRMPPFASFLSESDIDEIIKWLEAAS
jgi:hypothetical protein